MAISSVKKWFNEGEEETLALSSYLSAIAAFKSFEIDGFSIEDKETNNLYEENCRKRIGNFSYGREHRIKIYHGPNVYGTLTARVSASKSIYGNFGEVALDIDSASGITKKVVEAFESTQPRPRDDITRLIQDFNKGKSFCYGLCKRDR